MIERDRHGRRVVPGLGLVTLVALSAAACGGGAAGPSWTAVSDVSAFAASTVSDVTANGTGFVAVGNVIADGVKNGAIWTSTDGQTWQHATVDAPQATFNRVGHAGTGLVAVGAKCAGGECNGSSFWTSSDGKTWKETGVNDDLIFITAVANGSFGVSAVGADWTTGYPEVPADVAAYTSTDGSSWKHAPVDAALKGAQMGSVVAAGPGLVAVGSGQGGMKAWTSSDGVTWTASPASDSLKSGEIRDLVVHGSTIIGVGRDGQDAVAWTSADGVKWTRTASGAASLASAVMERLASTDKLVFAVGQDKATGVGAIWISSDGLSWTKAGSLPGGSTDLGAVAASGTTIVAFGTTANGSVVILRAQAGA